MTKVRQMEIEAVAEQIILNNNFFNNNIYNIMSLIKKEKIKVYEVKDEKWNELTTKDNVDAIIMIDKKVGKNILVKSGLLDEDKRFNLAHELGHLYLHAKEGEAFFAMMKHSCTGSQKELEDEADYFAACLLMPRIPFIKMYEVIKYANQGNSNENDIEKINPLSFIAQSFGVSPKSVRKRFEELGVNIEQ